MMNAINQHDFQTHWPAVRRRIRDRWPQLNDDIVEGIDGRVERLYQALVEDCGIPRADAARELSEFLRSDAYDSPVCRN
jgi:hypothetical protein